jgi:hypothetical protein
MRTCGATPQQPLPMPGHRLIDLQFEQDVGVRAKFGGEHHRHRLTDEPAVADWLGPAGLAAMMVACLRDLHDTQDL